MPTTLLENLLGNIASESKKESVQETLKGLPKHMQENPKIMHIMELGMAIGAIPEEKIKEANAAYKEARKLETELKLLVKEGKIPSYAFTQLYSILGEAGEAYMVSGPALRVSLSEGELVDPDGDIIPALREIIESRYVLVKDYEAYKETQKTHKQTIMVSKEVALQALSLGTEIQVEFTNEQGKAISMSFSSKNGNTSLPVQALIDGIFYIVQ